MLLKSNEEGIFSQPSILFNIHLKIFWEIWLKHEVGKGRTSNVFQWQRIIIGKLRGRMRVPQSWQGGLSSQSCFCYSLMERSNLPSAFLLNMHRWNPKILLELRSPWLVGAAQHAKNRDMAAFSQRVPQAERGLGWTSRKVPVSMFLLYSQDP